MTKRYEVPDQDARRTVLDQVDLRLGPDEAVGIVGPNGSGKSTLLRLAAGVTAPDEGTITRRGRTCAVIELGLGMHPDLTGRENVELNAALLGSTRRMSSARFAEIVEFAELGAVIDDAVRTYSSGMLARLSFAIAAHADADLLMLDEVLSVGDLAFQRRCRDRIAELRGGGTSVVIVSHDLGLIGGLCERTIILAGGSIDFDGPTDRAIRRYVGLPEPGPDPGGLTLELSNRSVRVGSEVVATVFSPAELVAERLRIDLVVRDHPSFLTVNERLSVVFGSTTLRAHAGKVELTIGTEGLPNGSFELCCTLEDAVGGAVASAAETFVVTGPAAPFAIRLPSRTEATMEPTEAQVP